MDQKTELTKDEIDIIGEVWNISMGSAATALSNIMNDKVVITSPRVENATPELLRKIETIPSVGVRINFLEGIRGSDLLIIRKSDVLEIVKHMLGEDIKEEDFGDLHISAIAEVMNQMMGAAATALSSLLKREINISPPDAFLITDENKEQVLDSLHLPEEYRVLVKFNFQIENLVQSELFTILTPEVSREIIQIMMGDMEQPEPDVKPASEPPVPARPEAQPAPIPPVSVPQAAPAAQASREAAAAYDNTVRMQDIKKTQVHPVELQNFEAPSGLSPVEETNFNLIQDVPLDISVEVGRARKLVKEIIDLSVGSIIELDKQAGDPVDVIVNGQLIAKGEVVVIDESFGVRITEIVDKKSSGK